MFFLGCDTHITHTRRFRLARQSFVLCVFDFRMIKTTTKNKIFCLIFFFVSHAASTIRFGYCVVQISVHPLGMLLRWSVMFIKMKQMHYSSDINSNTIELNNIQIVIENFLFSEDEIFLTLESMPALMSNHLFCSIRIIVRTCDALEAESEALKVDLSLMKQQSQALEAAYGAKFQNLISEFKQTKEKLRQFVCECQSLSFCLLEF